MEITNNILRYYLRNVHFFAGTACGGKTTISKIFAEKHNMLWVDEDSLNQKMSEVAEPKYQKAWFSRPSDWETYFNRPYREYHQWLKNCGDEMLPMELMELVKLSATRKVAVDIFNMSPRIARELLRPEQIVFLVTTPERLVRDYYDRPDHRNIYDCIMGLANPEASLENCNRMLAYGCEQFLAELEESGMYSIMRDENSRVETTLALVEKHFGV